EEQRRSEPLLTPAPQTRRHSETGTSLLSILAAQQFAAYPQEWRDSAAKPVSSRRFPKASRPESQSRIPAAALEKALGVAGLISSKRTTEHRLSTVPLCRPSLRPMLQEARPVQSRR